jgi:hypothetical protein
VGAAVRQWVGADRVHGAVDHLGARADIYDRERNIRMVGALCVVMHGRNLRKHSLPRGGPAMIGGIAFQVTRFAPTLGFWGVFGLGLAAFIRSLPKLREVSAASDTSLRGDLLARINMLESTVARLETQMVDAATQHSNEMQIMRHKLSNETQSLDALLMLLEAAPDKVADNMERIKAMRAARAQNISIERGLMAGAMVGKVEPT